MKSGSGLQGGGGHSAHNTLLIPYSHLYPSNFSKTRDDLAYHLFETFAFSLFSSG